ncbi:MAG: ligase-associated DNA damage response exonuclease [Saprospiraceae bacterium]
MVRFTDKGIYCIPGDFYIDPWRRVDKAVITHAHSDHARSGHSQYITVKESIPIMKFRLGSFIKVCGYSYGESFTISGVKVSFHPAGHIIGSAQVRLEYKGEIWVVSGDYKLENDGISEPFEPVKCHTFITESTFGLPIFRWQPQQNVISDINQWWKSNAENGIVSVIAAYSLGKAQRLLYNLDLSIGQIYTHAAIENIHNILRLQGYKLVEGHISENKLKTQNFTGSLVLAPPAAIGSAWTEKFGIFEEATVSGWMAVKSIRKKRNATRGFVLSDHADWEGLNSAIQFTGADKIYVTHGYSEIYAKFLREEGYDADVVKTEFSGDDESGLISERMDE